MNSVQFHVLSDALLRPVLLSVPKVTTRQCTGHCNLAVSCPVTVDEKCVAAEAGSMSLIMLVLRCR